MTVSGDARSCFAGDGAGSVDGPGPCASSEQRRDDIARRRAAMVGVRDGDQAGHAQFPSTTAPARAAARDLPRLLPRSPSSYPVRVILCPRSALPCHHPRSPIRSLSISPSGHPFIPLRQKKHISFPQAYMYSGTLRHNPNDRREGQAAETSCLCTRHERVAPKSHRSQLESLLLLQPFLTVSRSSTHTSPREAGGSSSRCF